MLARIQGQWGGNVLALTNREGVLLEQYRYDDYGVPAIFAPDGSARGASAWGNDLLFGGRPLFEETGFYYQRHRWYSPALGRFISHDPLGAWGDPASLGNPYSYAGQSPALFGDPMGLESQHSGICRYIRDYWVGSPPRLGPGVTDTDGFGRTASQVLAVDALLAQHRSEEQIRQSAAVANTATAASAVAEAVTAEATGTDAILGAAEAMSAAQDGRWRDAAFYGGAGILPGVAVGAVKYGDSADGLARINGRRPVNHRVVTDPEYLTNTLPLPRHLQQRYGIGGIRFNDAGFPDFSPVALDSVRITSTGNRLSDFDAADAVMQSRHPGWTRPRDYTWHHHEDGVTMQLVPTDVHEACRHTGGIAVNK